MSEADIIKSIDRKFLQFCVIYQVEMQWCVLPV